MCLTSFRSTFIGLSSRHETLGATHTPPIKIARISSFSRRYLSGVWWSLLPNSDPLYDPQQHRGAQADIRNPNSVATATRLDPVRRVVSGVAKRGWSSARDGARRDPMARHSPTPGQGTSEVCAAKGKAAGCS